MIKLVVALVSLILLTTGCESPPKNKPSRAQRLEDSLECEWLPNMKICVCQFSNLNVHMSWGGITRVPDRICDGEETGAIP